MKQILIIPNVNNIEESIKLADKYSLGFEYNEFFDPNVLDSEEKINEIISKYKSFGLPGYSTLHGAFFDVIPFSVDKRIKDISNLRIEQSIDVAKRLGVKGIVFHTNYNPFLNATAYVEEFVKQNALYWSDVLKKHSDVNIYLENMFDSTPDVMEALAEELSTYDNFGICLDYAHAALSKVASQEWARRLSKYIKHVHINDNDLSSDLHLAWGDGKIDRQSFYDCYEKYLSEATVLIETSLDENKLRSIEKLIEEGFMV